MAKDHNDAQSRMGLIITVCMRGPHPLSEVVRGDAHIVAPFDGNELGMGDFMHQFSVTADSDAARALRHIAQRIDERRLFGWVQDEIANNQIGSGEWDPPAGFAP